MKKLFLMMAVLSCFLFSFSQTKFKCPLSGLDKHGHKPSARIVTINKFKNRSSEPGSINPDITIEKILAKGNDTARFSNEDGAEITGFIVGVKSGGAEDCNCFYGKDEFVDTHIEIALNAGETDKSKVMVVELTPRFKKNNPDWRTIEIKKLKGKKVTVTGWMLFDKNHWQNSRNTNPHGGDIFRATAWEIHPVTSFTVEN